MFKLPEIVYMHYTIAYQSGEVVEKYVTKDEATHFSVENATNLTNLDYREVFLISKLEKVIKAAIREELVRSHLSFYYLVFDTDELRKVTTLQGGGQYYFKVSPLGLDFNHKRVGVLQPYKCAHQLTHIIQHITDTIYNMYFTSTMDESTQ